ncbi:MAG TPA: T9SS type A sorting domain-containing protein [Mucilaginibacter sp.]|nr:T9SS type A sorting domain-containing protein [Mucilaginibacter sp.]
MTFLRFKFNTLPFAILLFSAKLYAQAPIISYSTPQTFFVGKAITPLIPTNTGGSVPANVYGAVTVIAGNSPTMSPKDGIGTLASFTYPSYLSIDTSGNIYVCDNFLLRKITPSTVVSTLDLNGIFVSNPPASSAFQTSDMTIDRAGNMYINPALTNIIKKIAPGGTISSYGGNTTFVGIDGMITDKTGNLYICEASGAIRKITPLGVVTTLSSSLGNPSAMTIDSAGNLFVINNNAGMPILTITPQGLVSAKQFAFNPAYLAGMTVDINNNIYLGINSSSVSKPSSVIRLMPANDTSMVTTKLKPLLGGMVIDKQGNLIVAESTTALIKKVNLTGYTIDHALPAGLTFDSATGIISGASTVVSPVRTYKITAYNAFGSNSYSINIAVIPATTSITSLNPTAAITGGTVTIKGYKFTGATSVSFGGTPAQSFTVSTDTVITAKVGTGASGVVSVTTPSGNASINGFVFVPMPTVAANGPLTFLSTDSVTLTASPSSGYSYQWYNGNNPIVGATKSTYTVHQSGSYNIKIISGTVFQISTAVVTDAVFTLPQDNFSVSATSATCKGSADGVINITAVQNLNYLAAITGEAINTSYPFTSTLAVNGLPAGTYHVCISVEGQSAYKQCYDLIVAEPKDLSVYSIVNNENTSVTLNFSGADQYNIALNGILYTTTKEQTITVPLIDGSNDIVVTTDKPCQGAVEKIVNISGKMQPYPNPFQNILYVNLTQMQLHGNSVRVEIHNMSDGKLVYSKSFPALQGVLKLDVSGLGNGAFALHIQSGNLENVFKVLKD